METMTVDDVSVSTASPNVDFIDLNQATQTDLERLPGIGPALAQRILAYREAHGLFESPESITNVEGIGPVIYGRLAHRLTALPSESTGPAALPSLPEILPPPLPEAYLAEVAAEPPAGPFDFTEETSEPVQPAPTKPQPEPEKLDLQPEPPLAEPPKAMPVTPTAPSRARNWDWLWGALLGGLFGAVLGMLLTLLLLTGINGALAVENTRAFVELRGRAEAVEARQGRTDSTIQQMQQQLQALAGLPARVDQAEAALSALRSEVQTLKGTVADLNAELDALQTAFATVQKQMDTTLEFFGRLRSLLDQFFGQSRGPEMPPALGRWLTAREGCL